MQSLKLAVDDENLGRVKTILNQNPGLATEVYYEPDGEPYTILKRAERVATFYTSPESFAHKIVSELKKRGATMPPELVPQEEVYTNLYGSNTQSAAVGLPPQVKSKRPGLPPLYPISRTHVNVSQGIAVRPKSSRKRKMRRRKSARKTRRHT